MALVTSLAAVPPVAGQTTSGSQPNPFGSRPPTPQAPGVPAWAQPKGGQQQAATPATGTVIARVGGRDITQAEFDRIANPYFQQLRNDMGAGFTPEVRQIATFNVLDELIRRELLALEVERQNLQVTQAEVDAILMQDPFFQVNGTFDQAKFNAYKTSPGSNYLQVLPMIRETAALTKMDQTLRQRFTPTPAQLKAEWARRSDQVRFKMLPLLTRDMSTEPEATEAEWAEYYAAHPDQFMRKTRVRLRYARLPLPAATDTTRAAEEARANARAQGIADSLRRGTLADTAATLTDTGLFEVPTPAIPGLGRVAGLTDTLGKIDTDSTMRILGPYTANDAVIVAVVAERQPKHVPPMGEVLGDVKRRADAEKRRTANEAERRAYYDANLDHWRGPRAAVTRMTLDGSTITVAAPSPSEVERWYAQHGRTLFGVPDTSRAWQPPINDSLRAVVSARLQEEQRRRKTDEVMAKLATGLQGKKDPWSLARSNGAVAETLTFIKSGPADSLFNGVVVDSLLTTAVATRGTVQGPRTFGRHRVVWRVDTADTAFVPPYEVVRARSDQEFNEDRRRKDEAEARVHFDQRRDQYKTPVKYALDHVSVRIPPVDSVRITEAELRRQYNANPKVWQQEEQVQARHILFMTRDAGPDVERQARTRADSLLAAIRKEGGDFAELARRFSQEPGASSGGGDLGWFGRGRMVREFEDAAFALKPGEISNVVKTQFGYHIIKVEGRKAAGIRPFDEVRGELRTQMAQARGDSTARRSALALRRKLAAAADPKPVAAPYGGVVPAGPIAANEPIPAIGVAQGLAQDLPTLATGKWAPKVYKVNDRYLVLRVREKQSPRPAEFDEVRPQAVQDMKNAKRRAVLDGKVGTIRTALASGASVDSLAAPYGGMRDSGFLGVAAAFVPMLGSEPRVLEKAFASKPGVLSDTLQVAQGVVWIRLEEKKTADPVTYKLMSTQIEQEMVKKRYDAWVEEKKRGTRVEILRADLKGPRPTTFGGGTVQMGG